MDYDVVVVGAGNAALAAAVSAKETGAARVLVLEKAPEELRGGNTHYSGGLLRIAFDRTEDLLRLVPDAEKEAPGFLDGVQPYPAESFRKDLMQVTRGRTDQRLASILIGRSYETACWMAERGIRMEAAVSLTAVRHGGVTRWPSGAVIRAVHEGVGLSRMWFAVAKRLGIEVRYGVGGERLLRAPDGSVSGVATVDEAASRGEIRAAAVVLGCGGFEANLDWRRRYLAHPWDGDAKVRGTAYNMGDGLRMAMEVGAAPHGQWSGCHGTPISSDAPPFGDRELTDKTNRLSYPFGIVVNNEGRRFMDEGEDFNFYTYAKLGGIILAQPDGLGFQIFDAKVTSLLEGRYSTSEPVVAEAIEELAEKLPLDRPRFVQTVREYNDAVPSDGRFDPTVRDGLATNGLPLQKANWAQRIDTPPFRAYPVTGGITFTFGGVLVNDDAQVLDTRGDPIPGLFTCGEMVGGLFHYNYPGGSGLMSGAVFGRLAGARAARAAKAR